MIILVELHSDSGFNLVYPTLHFRPDSASILPADPNTSLNLTNNHFPKVASLIAIFEGLPRSITSIKLTGNNLGIKDYNLDTIFAAIPKSVTNLSLANNRLGEKTVAELTAAFAALPQSIRYIDLSNNFFGGKNDVEFAEIFTPLINSANQKLIILDTQTRKRLNKIFSSIDIHKTSSILTPKDSTLLQRANRFIFSKIYDTPKPTTDDLLSDQMLTKNENINITFLMEYLIFEIKKNTTLKRYSREHLFEPIPELKLSLDLLIKVLDSRPIDTSETSSTLTPKDSTLLQRANRFIFSKVYDTPKPTTDDLSFVQMLTENENTNLNLLMKYLMFEINRHAILKKFSLEHLSDSPEEQLLLIPELKLLHSVLIRFINSRLPLNGLCEQIVKNEKSELLSSLLYSLADSHPKALNELISQLRTFEPLNGLNLIGDLTWHIAIRSTPDKIAMQDAGFREQLVNNIEWLRNKDTLYSEDVDVMLENIKKSAPKGTRL